ncbi:hypothetical protein EHQ59_08445 [Leptospira kemamanensis]|uniref:Uncharacterized protein n=1 Tax=Leptospira kemamanensis TaxID=2484942 RepID=A0A4R9JRC4_9LEPT|nr:hypothetical protein [Leptospira kemamanensis]TGL53608.1 hypothetical protein EHQ59_08445 [Leptospira kemamanensis]
MKIETLRKLTFTIILSILTFTQCKIFKQSNLDPNSELSNFLNLFRTVAFIDAFNGLSQTLMIVQINDSTGNPISGGEIVYSVYNENDENNVAVSDFGSTGNYTPYKNTLGANGRTILKFSERGIAEASVYRNPGDTTPIGTFRFRNYKGITIETFSFYSITGEIQVNVEDLSNYPNPMGSITNMVPIGTANGRSFLVGKIFTSSDGGSINGRYDNYILSSVDGVTYDQVIPLNVNEFTSSSGSKRTLHSAITYDGSLYVVFVNEVELDSGNTIIGNRNLAFTFSPSSSSYVAIDPIVITLPVGIQILNPITSATLRTYEHPMFPVGSRFFVVVDNSTLSPREMPYLISLTDSNQIDLSSPTYNCLRTSINDFSAYGKLTFNGTDYLHCPTSTMPGTTINATVINGSDVSSNTLTFSAGLNTINSFPSAFANQLIGIAIVSGSPRGSIFPTGSYLTNGANIPFSSNISGFTIPFGGAIPILRNITSSLDVGYAIVADNANLGSATNRAIVKFTNQLDTATVYNLPTAQPIFNENTTSHRQFHSTQGDLTYYWDALQTVTSPASIGNFRFFATRNIGPDTWKDVKLIRIK